MNLKRLFGKDSSSEDFIDVSETSMEEKKSKVMVRPFTLRQYDDINDILAALREGYNIAVIDIKPIRTKDVIELKRAIAKIKKTVEAMEGTIAGFGENIIIATPQFAEVYKAQDRAAPAKNPLELY